MAVAPSDIHRPRRGRPPRGDRSWPNRLRAVREALGINPDDAAAVLGVTRSALYDYEVKGHLLRVSDLEKLALYYRVPPAALLNSAPATATAPGELSTAEERSLIRLFRKLLRTDRAHVIGLLRSLARNTSGLHSEQEKHRA